MGMVVTPRVEVLLLDRARPVGVDDVSLSTSAALGTCSGDGGRSAGQPEQTEQTPAADAAEVHACDDCDTSSVLSGEGGVFTTGVVTSGACDGEGSQSVTSEQTPAADEGEVRLR